MRTDALSLSFAQDLDQCLAQVIPWSVFAEWIKNTTPMKCSTKSRYSRIHIYVLEVGVTKHRVIGENGKVVRTLDANDSDFFSKQ